MGKGSMVVKNYKTAKGYFMSRYIIEKSNTPARFLIVPLHNFDDSPFFYVKEEKAGIFEVMGEGYEHYENWEASMIGYKETLADAIKHLNEKGKLGYYFTDESGRVVHEEWTEFPIKTS